MLGLAESAIRGCKFLIGRLEHGMLRLPVTAGELVRRSMRTNFEFVLKKQGMLACCRFQEAVVFSSAALR